jgi:pre-mRNA-splicing factor ISY1
MAQRRLMRREGRCRVTEGKFERNLNKFETLIVSFYSSYKYFGAAKDLPGVRELFEQEPPPPPRKTRGELMREVDANYYGYLDDDDGVLIPLEEKASKESLKKSVDEWKEKLKKGELNTGGNDQEDDEEMPAIEEDNANDELLAPRFVSHVSVPTQEDIENALLRKKKRELMEQYGI